MDVFELGAKEAAAGNPAQPVKSSLGSPNVAPSPGGAYLNTPGGAKAGKQGPDPKVAPAPGASSYAPGQPSAAANIHGSPDTGERGSTGKGDQTVTKSAAWHAGVAASLKGE